LSTAANDVVPYAAAAIACAPPSRETEVAPAASAAARTTGDGDGHSTAMSFTPATLAGTTVMTAVEGSGKRPPGT
jgi:hypothetical protein